MGLPLYQALLRQIVSRSHPRFYRVKPSVAGNLYVNNASTSQHHSRRGDTR